VIWWSHHLSLLMPSCMCIPLCLDLMIYIFDSKMVTFINKWGYYGNNPSLIFPKSKKQSCLSHHLDFFSFFWMLFVVCFFFSVFCVFVSFHVCLVVYFSSFIDFVVSFAFAK
jgi:hypothetical protein